MWIANNSSNKYRFADRICQYSHMCIYQKEDLEALCVSYSTCKYLKHDLP